MDGTSPFDTVVDAPVSYRTSSGIWAPHNYDEKFEGTITVLHALAESRNVPAVRTLARIGVDKVIKLCRIGSFPSEAGMFIVLIFCFFAYNEEKERF